MSEGLPLLERDVELSMVSAAAAAAREGKGRLIAIEGPPGIGKSRLLSEVVQRAPDWGLLPLVARASAHESGFAYDVVRQLFAAVARSDRGRLLAGPAEPAAKVLSSAGDEAAVPQASALHALLWLTLALNDRAPLLIAVDDVQWADTPSLRFLSYISRRLDGIRALVLTTRRFDEPRSAGTDGPGTALLAPVEHEILQPKPLSERGTAQLLEAVIAKRGDNQFRAACHMLSGGNPLLVHELARAVAAEALEPTAGSVESLASIGAAPVGRTVRARLAQLDPEATRLTEAAAILGTGQPLRHAAVLAGLSPEVADEAISGLRRIEVLAAGADIGFVHPLVHAAVLDGLPPFRAQQLHRRAAALLQGTGVPEEQVAHQLVDAGPADAEDVPLLHRVASSALASGDARTAARVLQHALEATDDDPGRVAILIELAEAENYSSHRAAEARLEQAATLTVDPVERARILTRLTSHYPSQRPAEALSVAVAAIGDLPAGEDETRRRLLAGALMGMACRPAPAGLSPKLLAEARSLVGDETPGARMLACTVGFYDAWTGTDATHVAQLVAPAFEGDWLTAAHAGGGGPFAFGVMALIAGDAGITESIVNEWMAFSMGEGSLPYLGGASMLRAHVAFRAGSLADAAEDAEQSLEAFAGTGVSGYAVSLTQAVLALVALERGDLETAARATTSPAAAFDDATTIENLELLLVRAHLRAVNGDVAGGLAETLAVGKARAAAGGHNPILLPWLRQAALQTLKLGDTDRAADLARQGLDKAHAWGTERAIGAALTVAGRVAGDAGLPQLEEAVERLETAPAPLERARAQLALGLALHATDRAEAARLPLGAALETAQLCGASVLTERARSALVATGARPRRGALRGPQALTAAERRVAERAATGHTNREIAAELHLTPRTVEIHLTRSYRKLGIASRTQLPAALSI